MQPEKPKPKTTEAARIGAILRNRWFRIVGILFLLYALFGFVLAPLLVTRYLPRLAEDHLHRQARIGEVRINPLVFTFEARDFSLSEPDGAPIAGFGRLFVDFETSSLLRRAWTFKDVHLAQPMLNLDIAADGTLNISRMIPASPEPAEPSEDSEPPRLLLNEIRIVGGTVQLTDRRQSTAATATVRPVSLTVSGLSTLPENKAAFSLEANLDEGGTLKSRGQATLNPVRSDGDIDIDEIPMATLWKFARDHLNIRKPGGRMGIQGHYRLDVSGSSADFALDRIDVQIAGLSLAVAEAIEPSASGAEANAILQLDRLAVEGGAFDLAARTAQVSRVAIEGGRVDLVKEADGRINLTGLAPPGNEDDQDAAETPAAEENAWEVLLKTIELSDFRVSLSDRTVKGDGTLIDLDPVNVSLSDVDGKSPMGLKAEIGVAQGGRIAVNGTIDPAGPSVASSVDVGDLALPPLQPYLDPVVDLLMPSGTFSTQGRLEYGIEAAEAELAYDGSFALADLKLTEPRSGETLLGWRVLEAPEIQLRLTPNRIVIPELRLEKPEGKFIIEEDRTTNVEKVFKNGGGEVEAAQPPSEPTEAQAFEVTVRNLRVVEGDMLFADLSLTPQFATRIHDLEGSVIGASSDAGARSQVALNGQVDRFGTAEIEGEINLFDPKGFTDIRMDFRNVEMSNLTPYSGRFAGRRIESGKLSLDLEYRIEEGQLLGDNEIIVDNLKLGDRVESPDAVNLPLDLAIALLENDKGIIDIGLPVRGDLTHPEFSFGALIGKALLNLLQKIITSPFRALAALLPEAADDLDTVVFKPGEPKVPPPELEKLLELTRALQQRPHLSITVQGGYSQEQDGEALRRLKIRRSLAERLGAKLEPDQDPGPVDYGNPDVQAGLERMFSERFGGDALESLKTAIDRQDAAAAKSTAAQSSSSRTADPGRLSKMLFTRLVGAEVVDESEFTTLAEARAQSVIDRLTGEGALAPQRVRRGDPKPIEAGGAPAAKLELAAGNPS
ncbi:MAG: DUF748 domain-containing protein [Desulfobacterales bacterium]